MSIYTTKYKVKNSNGNADLVNVFQINPNNTLIDRPFTINSGTVGVSYNSGFYILSFQSNSQITLSNLITNPVYVVCVGGGGGGSGGKTQVSDKHPGSGGNGGGFVNGYFSRTDANSTLNIVIGSGGTGQGYDTDGTVGSDSSITSTDSSVNVIAKGGNGGKVLYPPDAQTANTVTNITSITNSPAGIISGNHANIYSKTIGSDNVTIYQSASGLNGFSAVIPPNSNNICYYAGGGASGGYFRGGTFSFTDNVMGGLGGGGNGQYCSPTSPYYPVVTPNTNGVDYTGGGGGGGTVKVNSGVTTAIGGNGGKGNVTIYFEYP